MDKDNQVSATQMDSRDACNSGRRLVRSTPPGPKGIRSRNKLWSTAALCLLVAGCAFDVVSVKQQPATFSSASDSPSFLLVKEVKARLGTGFPTILKANTTWNQVGVTESGKVYATKDQVVKVEASNIYEAQIVITNHALVGFYLPVEKTFSPLSSPMPLETKAP
jgi:hypothetical protein